MYFIEFDVNIFLSACLGDKQHPMQYLIPLTIFNCLVFVTGTVGNVLVCFIIMKNASMKTSTNFFLVSLAVSDITMLIFGKQKYESLISTLGSVRMGTGSRVYVRTVLTY